MERKLASIQIIENIQPIEGADFIEVACVLGWECVIKKGEYRIGDHCIYIEIDSIVPDILYFEFMKERKFRVKTIKLKKQISQGLVVPLSLLKNRSSGMFKKYYVGDDVTKELGVKKYDPEIVDGRTPGTKHHGGLNPFPLDVPKTDEIRIQSAPQLLEEMKGKPFYRTQKQDGCSATYMFNNNGKFLVCSRNHSIPEFHKIKRSWRERLFAKPWRPFTKYNVKTDESLYWRIARKYDIQEKIKSLEYFNFAFQGEICAPGLQKNRLRLTEPDFFVFDVFDRNLQRYLNFDSAFTIVSEMRLRFVPLLETGRCFNYTKEDLLEKAKGFYPGTKNHKEGDVWRCYYNDHSNVLNEDKKFKSKPHISFKVLNNDYLLKEE